MTTIEQVLQSADDAMEEALSWIETDQDYDTAADFIVATAALPIKWHWNEGTPGVGVVFEAA